MLITRSQFPRVLELIDLIEDRGAAGAYFRDFETLVEQDSDMARVWSCRELEFQKLDKEAWSVLRARAAPYLIKRRPNGRGWSQLVSIFNEARGYIYLSEIGCTNIRFIPRVKKKGIETSDLIGELNAARVLCEVKTVQISDIEIQARRNSEVRSAETSLTPEFLNKLDDTFDKARNQLFAYEGGNEALRIVFIVLNLDDWLGAHKRSYYNQIDAHLAQQDSRDYEIVFFNGRTVFHEAVSMKFARVVNEPG
jgi:hypothetical protein